MFKKSRKIFFSFFHFVFTWFKKILLKIIRIKESWKKAMQLLEFSTVLIALMVLPFPFFDNHTFWDDLIGSKGGEIDLRYLKDNDKGDIVFQIINNNLHPISDIEIKINLFCDNQSLGGVIDEEIYLKSDFQIIPSNFADVFHISGEEISKKIKNPYNIEMHFGKMDETYNIGYKKIGENIYFVDQKGGISKNKFSEINEKFRVYQKACKLSGILNYSYARFGKKNNFEKVIEELKNIPVYALASEVSKSQKNFRNNFTFFSGTINDVCASKDNSYGSNFCDYWICKKIQKKYPDENITCKTELEINCLDEENELCEKD